MRQVVGTAVTHEVGDIRRAVVVDLDVIGGEGPVEEGGVEADAPVDSVVVVAAPDEVVTALAVDLVIAVPAVEVVPGRMDVSVERVAIPAENTIDAATAPESRPIPAGR